MDSINIINTPLPPLEGLILRLAELGLDESEIMYSLELTRRKFNALKRQKSISEALTTGLETRARRVEDALYRRATGFEYEEIRTVSPLSGGTKGGQKTETSASAKSTKKSEVSKSPPFGGIKGGVTLKTVPPDVTACIFWLKNRLPDKWREGKELTTGKKSFQEILELYDEEDENLQQ
jgi:hypothetical protein